MNACINANLDIKDDEEEIDVCTAIQMMNERAAEAAAKETRINILAESVRNLTVTLDLTVDQAMDALKVEKVDREKLLKYL